MSNTPYLFPLDWDITYPTAAEFLRTLDTLDAASEARKQGTLTPDTSPISCAHHNKRCPDGNYTVPAFTDKDVVQKSVEEGLQLIAKQSVKRLVREWPVCPSGGTVELSWGTPFSTVVSDEGFTRLAAWVCTCARGR